MLAAHHPETDCKGEITRDMLEDMLKKFDRLSDKEGVMKIELRGNGLFIQNPKTGTLDFVGVARLSQAMNHLR